MVRPRGSAARTHIASLTLSKCSLRTASQCLLRRLVGRGSYRKPEELPRRRPLPGKAYGLTHDQLDTMGIEFPALKLAQAARQQILLPDWHADFGS